MQSASDLITGVFRYIFMLQAMTKAKLGKYGEKCVIGALIHIE